MATQAELNAPSQEEIAARLLGWIAEIEFNGEDDGVRHPDTQNWAENWVNALVISAEEM